MSVAEELADAFDEANDHLSSFAPACTEAQWRTLVPGENWPVGVIVHHCAAGHRHAARVGRVRPRGEDIDDTG